MTVFNYAAVTTAPYMDYIQVRDSLYDLIIPPPWAKSWSFVINGLGWISPHPSGPPGAPLSPVEGAIPAATFGVPFSDTDPLPTLYPHSNRPDCDKVTTVALAGNGAARMVKVIFDVDGENR